MELLLTELTVWHWLALGLVLFGIEMLTGTFDLLMVAIAAWITAGFTYFAPNDLTTWQGQMIVFGLAAIALVVLGRTVLSGMRSNVEEHPTLNKRMVGLIGQRGRATGDFTGQTGQVSIGDSVWGAEAVDGEIIRAGDDIVVESARMTTAIVRRA